MFAPATAAAKAAAPHVGKALVQGGKALVGAAIAAKSSAYAKDKGMTALEDIDDAVGAAKSARRERIEWENITAHEQAQTA